MKTKNYLLSSILLLLVSCNLKEEISPKPSITQTVELYSTYDGISYKLVTIFDDNYLIDFGTFKEIKELKCQRYNEAKMAIDSMKVLQTPCK